LDIDGLEHAREARAEHGVELVGVVEDDEGGVYALWFEIAQEGSSDGTHSLDVSTCFAAQ
jgi:hypothetical protein